MNAELAEIIFSTVEDANAFTKALNKFLTDWGISLETLNEAIQFLLKQGKR